MLGENFRRCILTLDPGSLPHSVKRSPPSQPNFDLRGVFINIRIGNFFTEGISLAYV